MAGKPTVPQHLSGQAAQATGAAVTSTSPADSASATAVATEAASTGAAWSFDVDLAGLLADAGVVYDPGHASEQDDLLATEIEARESGSSRVADITAQVGEHLPAGPFMAAWLTQCPTARASDFELPGLAASYRKLASWAQAAELTAVAEIAARSAAADGARTADNGMPLNVPTDAAAQVGLALDMTQASSTAWVDLAMRLRWRLPRTGTALAAGDLDLQRTRIIVDGTSVLADEQASTVEEQVLAHAPDQTTGQLRASVHRAVIAADPDGAEERRKNTERLAKVSLYPDPEGTAALTGTCLPGVHAAAAMARITAMARALRASGAQGGLDLLRAQIFLGLLLGTMPLIPPPADGPPDSPPPPDDGSPDGPLPADQAPPPDGDTGSSPPADTATGPGDSAPPDQSPPPDGQTGRTRSADTAPRPDGPLPADQTPPPDVEAGRTQSADTAPRPDGPLPADQSPPPDSETDSTSPPGDRATPDALPAARPGSSPAPGSQPGYSSSPDGRPAGRDARVGRPGSGGRATTRAEGPEPTARPPAGATPDTAAAQHGPGNPLADICDFDDHCPPGPWTDIPCPGDEDAPPEDPAETVDVPAWSGRFSDDQVDADDWAVSPDWPVLPYQLPATGAGARSPRPWSLRGPAGLLDVLMPWSALAGFSSEPAAVSRIGPITSLQGRQLLMLAARSPQTEWRVIVTDDDGRALAVTRARVSWERPTRDTPSPDSCTPERRSVPADFGKPSGAAAFDSSDRTTGVVGRVTIVIRAGWLGTALAARLHGLAPLPQIGTAVLHAAARAAGSARADTEANAAAGGCAHSGASELYRPPSRMRELIAARDGTCRYVTCGQPAWRTDLDHTEPWHKGGLTCSCNLGGCCRTHHKLKQRPGWSLEQPEAGVFRWTTPAGRTYVTRPDLYPV